MGATYHDRTSLSSTTDWQQGFELNFFSSVADDGGVPRRCLDPRGWGRIVHVASTYGVEPGPYFGQYSAAKAALLNYSKNLSHAYSAQGVLFQLRGLRHHDRLEAINDTAARSRG